MGVSNETLLYGHSGLDSQYRDEVLHPSFLQRRNWMLQEVGKGKLFLVLKPHQCTDPAPQIQGWKVDKSYLVVKIQAIGQWHSPMSGVGEEWLPPSC